MHPRHSRLSVSCFTTLFALLTAFVILPGCGPDGEQETVDRILIRVGECTATVEEFYEAFQSGIVAAAVQHDDMEALRSARYRTLNRLTEELIVLERARELKIRISDEELALAANDFKKDFPDDTFEQTLIENGISYLVWEKGLKRRLLMEKVVRQDVLEDSFPVPLSFDEAATARMDADALVQSPGEDEDTAKIETEDADALPDEAPPENGNETAGKIQEQDARPNETEEISAPSMPGNRAESGYNQWLARLKNQYTIEINWELWEKIDQGDTGGS